VIGIAYGMGPGGVGGGQQSPYGTFLMLGAIFAIFYFLMIRPQQKRQKQQRELLTNLKKGDTVITGGGLIGRITGLTDAVVTLELAEKVRVKVLRSSVTSVSSQPLLGDPPKRGERKKSKEESEGAAE
jgi:preprotein translocase subunit YajC